MKHLVVACAIFLSLLMVSSVYGAERNNKRKFRITAYTPAECGYITASGTRVSKGICAISRDVEKNLGVSFGDKFYVHGVGIFKFEDRTHKSLKNTIDIFFWNQTEAKKFGAKECWVTFTKDWE
jgi:3D (Asp-Asp-Asp) domain-containing protein